MTILPMLGMTSILIPQKMLGRVLGSVQSSAAPVGC